MRRLAYLFLVLIIVACSMREAAYILEIKQPHEEGVMGMLYDWAFYGKGDNYNIINYVGAFAAVITIGILRQLKGLQIAKLDPSKLDITHVESEIEAFKAAFPQAKIEEAS